MSVQSVAYMPLKRLNQTRHSLPLRFHHKPDKALKTAKKVARVYSQVKTKLNQKAIREGTGGSSSKFFYGRRKVPAPYRRVIKGLSKNYRVLNGSFRINQTVGLQYPVVGLDLYQNTDLVAMSGMEGTNKTNKILHQSVTAELSLTNQDAGNVRIVLYDCIARRDGSLANVSDPYNAWSHSYADEGGNNTDLTVVGATPFSSDLFTQFFKVLKMTHCTLAQGQSHTHRVHFAPNKIVDEELVQYQTYNIKGISIFTMIVAYGLPCNDSVTNTQVSTGQVGLAVTSREQYKFTYLQDNITNWKVTNNLINAFTISEEIMNVGTGAKSGDTEA